MIYENEEYKSKYKIEYFGEKISKEYKIYKLIIIETYEVGKTSIIHRLMNKEIDTDYAPTISLDIVNFQVKVNDKIIQIEIWDTCGNDTFVKILQIYLKMHQ